MPGPKVWEGTNAEMPEIDVLLGTTSFPEIIEAVKRSGAGKRVLNIRHPDFAIPEDCPGTAWKKPLCILKNR